MIGHDQHRAAPVQVAFGASSASKNFAFRATAASRALLLFLGRILFGGVATIFIGEFCVTRLDVGLGLGRFPCRRPGGSGRDNRPTGPSSGAARRPRAPPIAAAGLSVARSANEMFHGRVRAVFTNVNSSGRARSVFRRALCRHNGRQARPAQYFISARSERIAGDQIGTPSQSRLPPHRQLRSSWAGPTAPKREEPAGAAGANPLPLPAHSSSVMTALGNGSAFQEISSRAHATMATGSRSWRRSPYP